jgi:hypothetical protein
MALGLRATFLARIGLSVIFFECCEAADASMAVYISPRLFDIVISRSGDVCNG